MNQYREEFDERKGKVLSLLEDTGAFLMAQDRAGDAASMLELKKNIEGGLFSIVLIGEFSAGKSMFLNALMHKRILPSFAKETTATVNFLRHTSQAPNGEKGIVYYVNGSQKVLEKLDIKTIEKVVSTRGDTADQRIAVTVEKVDLFLENKFLQDGVMLVDSPGLNGVAENLAEITQRQIRESHASIFMFSADHPGSKTDFEALRDLKEQCNSIFIVLNKIDLIQEAEGVTVDEIIDDLKRSYHKQFPQDNLPEIYPVSGRYALAARDDAEPDPNKFPKDEGRRRALEEISRLGDFEARLWKYLTQGERAREQLSSPVNKVLVTLRDQKETLEQMLKLLNAEQGTDELDKQKAALEEVISDLNKNKREASKSLQARFNKVISDAKDKVQARCDEIEAMFKAEIAESDNLSDYAADVASRLDRRCNQLVQRFDSNLRDDFMMIVDEESDEQFGDIEKALMEATGAEFKLSQNTFSLTVEEVGKRLEEDRAKQDRLFDEKQKLEEELAQLEKRSIQARKKERELDALKKDLRDAQERRHNIEDNFMPPPVHVRTQPKVEQKWRDGLLGWIVTPLIGKKNVITDEVIEDSSERDQAIARQNARLSDIDSAITDLKNQIQSGNTIEAGSEELDYDIGRKKIALLERQKAYEESVREFQENLKREAEQARKKMSRQITNFVEERVEESKAAIVKYLCNTKAESLKSIEGLLSARINEELKRQQEKLDKLLAASRADAEERDKKLQSANDALETLRQLMSRGIDLDADINESMNDTIADA